MQGQRLIGLDLSGLDLSGQDLNGVDLSRANLEKTNLFGAQLEGAVFYEATLDHAELSGAHLKGANFEKCQADHVGFGRAVLDGALFRGAQLSNATFSGASAIDCDFGAAGLQDARFVGATLRGATFERANLSGADLSETQVADANFKNAGLREAVVTAMSGYQSADWIGCDVRDVDASHAHLFRRFVGDVNFLEEFRQAHPSIHRLWSISSDCGRSLVRWGAWTFFIVLIYAGFYALADISYGGDRTWFSPVYYSIVTMTTLGYGDVLPQSMTAQALAASQAILGYVMLGGLLSILSTKMARRSE